MEQLNNSEFQEFLDNIKEWEDRLVLIAAASTPHCEPLAIEVRLSALRRKAKELGVSDEHFEDLYRQATAVIEKWKEREEPAPDFFDGGKFLHNVMGDYLIKKFSVCKINDSIHIYDNGVYKAGEDTLHGHMIKLVPSIRDSQRREVYKYIKASLDTPVKELSPPNLIPFATRIYDIDDDCFLDYSPEYVFLNRFPYDYKPNAPECPTITNVIRSIANGDQEVIDLLYEAMGNCFYLLNSFRGAVMLYGRSGNNGKSTLLNMITQLLGRSNASFLSLQDTAERFRLIDVYGKAANIGDDIPDTYLPDSSIFKKLVTGENVMAEKKGQDPIPFRPYAKMFFAMNGLPTVKSRDDGFFSRILLIPLTQDFSKSKNKDVKLKDKRWSNEEMEFLTRLAVEGLKRLMKNGDFTRPEIVQEAVDEYMRENDPIGEFLEEQGDLDGLPIPAVYQNFKSWCEESGRKAMHRTKFTQEICRRTELISASIRHPYYNGKTGRCFVNP